MGQLVGRITIDDVDVITEQADEDRHLMSGITEDVEKTIRCGRTRGPACRGC